MNTNPLGDMDNILANQPEGFKSAVVNATMLVYNYDAEFHAAVDTAIRVVSAEQRKRTGTPFSEEQIDAARMGAAVALYLKLFRDRENFDV